MPLDIDLGVDLTITDEAPPSAAPTATDTLFLIHSTVVPESPDGVQELRSAAQARAVYPGENALLAITDAYFAIGGGRVFVSPLAAAPATPADAAGLFLPQSGPGQLIAPEVVTTPAQVTLRDWAWENNRIYIADTPDGATQAQAEALATGLIDDAGGRFSALECDTLLTPGVAGGAAREVAGSVIKAALIARSDISTGNPNLAAAGNHTPGSGGETDYVLGIKAERSAVEQKALAQAQVNCFRTVNNRVRAYGFWTLADLTVLPQWWDLSGSRTVMAAVAREQAMAEEMMFGEVDANGHFLDRYKGGLSGVLAELQRIGAIYGTAQRPGYTVDVSAVVNPPAQVGQGLIEAQMTIKTSPLAAALKITLTRQSLSA